MKKIIGLPNNTARCQKFYYFHTWAARKTVKWFLWRIILRLVALFLHTKSTTLLWPAILAIYLLKSRRSYTNTTARRFLSFQNQLGVVQACDDLADLWGLHRSPDSTLTPTPVTTPARAPSPTVSPTSTQASPSLFSEIIVRKFSSHENFSGLWRNLSSTHFKIPVKRQQSNESDITPEKY